MTDGVFLKKTWSILSAKETQARNTMLNLKRQDMEGAKDIAG
jgi:hypothetical protein